MTQSKIQVLIEGLKASNEVMKKQIEIHQRTIELLGDLITEPESLPVEIPTHGLNDVPNIINHTDEQL